MISVHNNVRKECFRYNNFFLQIQIIILINNATAYSIAQHRFHCGVLSLLVPINALYFVQRHKKKRRESFAFSSFLILPSKQSLNIHFLNHLHDHLKDNQKTVSSHILSITL